MLRPTKNNMSNPVSVAILHKQGSKKRMKKQQHGIHHHKNMSTEDQHVYDYTSSIFAQGNMDECRMTLT
jgi:hypothetical protein